MIESDHRTTPIKAIAASVSRSVNPASRPLRTGRFIVPAPSATEWSGDSWTHLMGPARGDRPRHGGVAYGTVKFATSAISGRPVAAHYELIRDARDVPFDPPTEAGRV